MTQLSNRPAFKWSSPSARSASLYASGLCGALVIGLSPVAQAFTFEAGEGDQKVTAKVYGYARLNAVYDINEDIGLTTQSGNFSGLDFSGDAAEGFFDADAQQSRLGVEVTHQSGLLVKLETDFRGGNLRLRHAYGEYGSWMVGRNWSNFNSFVGFTSTLDFDATAGNAGVQDRAAQVRYTTGGFSVSLEDPRFQRIAAVEEGGLNVGIDSQKQSMPAATARYEEGYDRLTISVAALIQQLAYDAGDGIDDSAFGYGTFAAARYDVTENFRFQGALSYTDGANGYLYRSGNGGFGAADAYIADGDLKTLPGYGGTIGFGVDVGPGTVNVSYGWVKVDWNDAADDLGEAAVASRHEVNDNAFVNYQWQPIENVVLGVEYGYFHSRNYAEQNADANRVLFAAQYDF